MKRIGQVIPSRNTLVEDVSIRVAACCNDRVAFHGTRIPVTHFRNDVSNEAQFNSAALLGAVQLLAHSEPDAIVWNGSSGGLLGMQSDHSLKAEVEAQIDVPFTTTMLAVCEAMERFDSKAFTLITPYEKSMSDRYARSLEANGLKCVGSDCFGLSDVLQMSRVDPKQIIERARASVSPSSDALLIVCTNFPGAYVVDELERTLGIPVIDSTIATLWKGLRLAGFYESPAGWGRLMSLQ